MTCDLHNFFIFLWLPTLSTKDGLIPWMVGKILSLIFLSFLHILYIYLPWFEKVLTDSLTRDSSDFIDILRLAFGAKNGLKIGQEYSVLTRNLH